MSHATERRPPQVFDPSDPRLRQIGAKGASGSAQSSGDSAEAEILPQPPAKPSLLRVPTAADLQRGINWGLWLACSAISLLAMSIALRFWTFVWELFLRQDWIGWVAVTLAAILVLSLVMLLAGEVLGMFRLAKLQKLRRQTDAVLLRDAERAQSGANQPPGLAPSGSAEVQIAIRDLYAKRPELAWARARLAALDSTIMNGSERLAVLDRELMAAVDEQAKVAIAQSARRVSVVTAIAPFALFDMSFVLYENLRMLRRVATIYGGRPGLAALFRLASRVLAYVVASGGVALTDDLLGQFIGQGLAKRLSARAGQGMFNGGLTVRLGVATIDLCRPMPFVEAKRPRFRELALEVARGLTGSKAEEKAPD